MLKNGTVSDLKPPTEFPMKLKSFHEFLLMYLFVGPYQFDLRPLPENEKQSSLSKLLFQPPIKSVCPLVWWRLWNFMVNHIPIVEAYPTVFIHKFEFFKFCVFVRKCENYYAKLWKMQKFKKNTNFVFNHISKIV